MDKPFVLATDLDGTFLGGTEADRRALYDWIERNRDTVGLIFVSGRDPDFIYETCASKQLPWPEFVVCDVGTSIAQVHPNKGITPIDALEREISAQWNDSGDAVREALKPFPGLVEQETPFRYRVSFDYDPQAYDPRAAEVIDGMGHDVLISDDRFLDVLPRGVSKGPSLLRLLDHLSIDPARVLAAGDTLNDLSMLVAGTPAVAVGGSEGRLIAALPDLPRIHRARAIGAAGIVEAMIAFDLHPDAKEILTDVI
ncbi:alpha,alpha-trehalose-phosphate synthase [Sulfitobacter alexandrii]|uniref:Alpha,alpha-trehalose-phosphate synthase n=1 Tax=Sulfitobacter alexandrii TaxID=1917485 RepID=A0A1J0WEQ6_9RHOB|nr:HAD-IIB family hydrolase [Sulfitobacter alexandrii]APE42796.1 alpha,alpha-trehalose-phosphate synthase [Sulfitobacter alexandrii]